MRNNETAWLIGCCGGEWQHTLDNLMYLEKDGLFFWYLPVVGMSCVEKEEDCVKFNLFDMESQVERE